MLSLLILSTTALAGELVTIEDHPRPLHMVAHEVALQHGGAASFEELPILCADDIHDYAPEYGAPAGVEIFGRSKRSYSFMPNLTVSFPADMERMVSEWNVLNPTQEYRTEVTTGMVHIVPAQGLDEGCALVSVIPLLGVTINVTNQPRSLIEVVTEVRSAMAAAHPVAAEVSDGTVMNGDQWLQTLVTLNTEGTSAREALYAVNKMVEGTRGFSILRNPGKPPTLSLSIYRLPAQDGFTTGPRAPFTAPAGGDIDGDDIANATDTCNETAPNETVLVNGCSLQQTCPCTSEYANNGEFVGCLNDAAKELVAAGTIQNSEKHILVGAAKAACP